MEGIYNHNQSFLSASWTKSEYFSDGDGAPCLCFSAQRSTNSLVRHTNTKATHQGTISSTWMAAGPSGRRWFTATWQVAETHANTFPNSTSSQLKCVFFSQPEDKTWTVVQHNNSELTRVQPSAGKSRHTAHFEYTSGEEQLVAIISRSEHCEQELSYHCRKSRLFNTPGEQRSFMTF